VSDLPPAVAVLLLAVAVLALAVAVLPLAVAVLPLAVAVLEGCSHRSAIVARAPVDFRTATLWRKVQSEFDS
jgi:hypothetical protein